MERMKTGRVFPRIVAILASVLLGAAAIFSLFLPFPKAVESAAQNYVCIWSDGEETEGDYAQFAPLVSGVSEEGVVLSQDGKEGVIAASTAFSHTVNVFENDSLAELLTCSAEDISPLEKLALWREYGNRCYYDGDFFAWDGERFFRTSRKEFSQFVLLRGSVAPSVFRNTGAHKLYLRAEAEVSVSLFMQSNFIEIVAQEPYFTKGDALYLRVPGGTRLVAALPQAKSLTVSADFLTDGALAPCTALKELTLPFLNSLRDLFGDEAPALDRVKVEGAVSEYAFYGTAVREIDLCGVPASAVSAEAFVGCAGLETLHTTLQNPDLRGEFTRFTAPCGCYIYQAVQL